MGFHELEKLIVLWETEQITIEQAIGQILQHLREIKARMRELERRLWELEKGVGK
jgi:chromosome segregation ATPase